MTSDLLKTYPTIAEYLNTTTPSAKMLAKRHGLPVFKLGAKTVAARRSTLDAWIAAREAGKLPE